MKKQKKWSVRMQLAMLCVIPLIVMVTVVAVYSIRTMRRMVHDTVMEGLVNLTQSIEAAYNALDPGDYRFEEGKLYKGEYCITDHEAALDSFVKGNDTNVALFFGDAICATSMRDSTGERIVGVKAPDKAIQVALKGGQPCEIDNASGDGNIFYAYYIPIRDTAGKTVGMISAGEPATAAMAKINKATAMILGISLLILAAALAVCLRLAGAIAQVITKTESMLSSLADGDLQLEVSEGLTKRDDEIGVMGRAVARLLEKLQKIIGSIKKNTATLMDQGETLEAMASQAFSSTESMSSAMEDISKGAASMAENADDANGQVVSMGAIIEKIVESVGELDDLSGKMHLADTEASKIIHELSESNDKTTDAIRKIEKSVRTTNESVIRIQDAVNLIASIASETSLLALNASIEAARAGEAGRGFAVVATQISKLSEDSAQSTKTIEDIIHQLTEDSEMSVQIMNEVNEIIIEQQRKLVQTKDKFGDVSRGIERSRQESKLINDQATECDGERGLIVDVIQNLSAASQENAAATQEANSAMEELNATISQLAKAAGGLKQMAQVLEGEVAFFKI